MGCSNSKDIDGRPLVQKRPDYVETIPVEPMPEYKFTDFPTPRMLAYMQHHWPRKKQNDKVKKSTLPVKNVRENPEAKKKVEEQDKNNKKNTEEAEATKEETEMKENEQQREDGKDDKVTDETDKKKTEGEKSEDEAKGKEAKQDEKDTANSSKEGTTEDTETRKETERDQETGEEEIKMEVEEEPDDYPPLEPPKSLKKKAFNPEEYEDMDKKIRKVSKDLAMGELEELVDHLCTYHKTDVGRIRAFYVWIASQDVHLFDLSTKTPKRGSALYRLIMIRAGHDSFNRLFSDMCSLADIPCKRVSGRVKGSSYIPGGRTPYGNDWCLVHVSGEWRIVDQFFGSLTIRGDNSVWAIKGVTSTQKTLLAALSFSFELDDFYFLPEPEHFIYDHHTAERQQLLVRPVKESEFHQMARLMQGFFRFDLVDVDESRCTREIDDGHFKLMFTMPPKSSLKFNFVLLRSTGHGITEKHGDHPLSSYVRIETEGNKKIILADYPEIGQYKLDVFATDVFTNREKRYKVGEWILNVLRPNFRCKPLPQNARGECGVGVEMMAMGLIPVSHKHGMIKAENGEIDIEFKRRTPNVEVTHTLESNSQSKAELKDFTLQSDNGEKVVIHAKFPKAEMYALKLYTKKKGSKRPFENTATYFIESDVAYKDGQPFPSVRANLIGNIPNHSHIVLTPITHKNPLFSAAECGTEDIRMKTNVENLEFDLKLSRRSGTSYEDLSEYVWWQMKGKKEVEFQVRFPKSGVFSFAISARSAKKRDRGKLARQISLHPAEEEKEGQEKPDDEREPAEKQEEKEENEGDEQEAEKNQDGEKNAEQNTEEDKTEDKKDADKTADDATEENKAEEAATGTTKDEKKPEESQKEETSKKKEEAKPKKKPSSEQSDDLTQKEEAAAPAPERRNTMALIEELDINDAAFEEVYIYTITADYPCGITARSFPTVCAGWDSSSYVLGGPASGVIFENEEVHFDIKVPDAAIVVVRDKNGKTYELVKDKNGRFVGDVPTGEGGNELTVMAKLEGSEGFVDLLIYRVLTEEERKEEEELHAKAAEEAEKRRQQLKGQSEKEEELAEKRKEEEEEKVRKAEEEFDKKGKSLVAAEKAKIEAAEKQYAKKMEAIEKKYEEMQGVLPEDEEAKIVKEELVKIGGEMESEEVKIRILMEQREEQERQVREELKKAIKNKDKVLLQTMILQFKKLKLVDHDGTLKQAEKLYDFIIAKERLEEAVQKRSIDAITQALSYIRKRNYEEKLKTEVAEAEKLLQRLKRLHRLRMVILNMDKRTMSEIRSYKNPPEVVHQVMAASLLMLGNDEKQTSDWEDCAQLCIPVGSSGLFRRVKMFEIEYLNPEIKQRAKEMLKYFDIVDVQIVSAGAACFYKWATGNIEEAEAYYTEKQMKTDVKPATVDRQREIFKTKKTK